MTRPARFTDSSAEGAALRADQAMVDADIEGLGRDIGADRLVAEMEADGVPHAQRLRRLNEYFLATSDIRAAE